jgi:putative transposase
MTKQLTINAIEQAIIKEKPAKGLIFHSDRGSQYAAYAPIRISLLPMAYGKA